LGRLAFDVQLRSMSTYDVRALPSESLLLMFVSTTGDGAFPDAATQFWRFLLRRDLPASSLSAVRCAIFGLGDSSYPKFNAAARKLQARMVQLGAAPLVARGLGDDQSALGVEGDLDAWLPTVVAALDAVAPAPPGLAASTAPGLIRCRYEVAGVPGDHAPSPSALPAYPASSAAVAYAAATTAAPGREEVRDASTPGARVATTGVVIENRRLTAADWQQDVRHLVLQLQQPAAAQYRVGDVAVVYPRNAGPHGQAAVERLASRLGLGLDNVVSIRVRDAAGRPGDASPSAADRRQLSPAGFDSAATEKPLTPLVAYPSTCTVRHLLQDYLDISGTRSAQPAPGPKCGANHYFVSLGPATDSAPTDPLTVPPSPRRVALQACLGAPSLSSWPSSRRTPSSERSWLRWRRRAEQTSTTPTCIGSGAQSLRCWR
jgi:sulfite reductase alpha subunit-like flavoprotein